MDSILLTNRASEVTTPSFPSDLSSLQHKLFDYKEQERSSGPNIPIYSEKVLTGNWFERRVVYHSPPNEWITIYSTHYKPYDAKYYEGDFFTNWKNKEKIEGTERKIVISDGDAYLNNMTSSYDLSYRILPKDMCGPRIRVFNVRRNAWVPESELALSFGNQTKYGLVEAIKEEQRLAEYIPPWQTVYQEDYIKQPTAAKDLSRIRFPKRRGEMNTPDLRHLGIILSPATKLTAREPQYRSSQYGKMCTWL